MEACSHHAECDGFNYHPSKINCMMRRSTTCNPSPWQNADHFCYTKDDQVYENYEALRITSMTFEANFDDIKDKKDGFLEGCSKEMMAKYGSVCSDVRPVNIGRRLLSRRLSGGGVVVDFKGEADGLDQLVKNTLGKGFEVKGIPPLTGGAAVQNCEGGWLPNYCDADCGERTFQVTTASTAGGRACDAVSGDNKACARGEDLCPPEYTFGELNQNACPTNYKEIECIEFCEKVSKYFGLKFATKHGTMNPSGCFHDTFFNHISHGAMSLNSRPICAADDIVQNCPPICEDVQPPSYWNNNSCAKQQAAGKCPKRVQENSKYCRKTCGMCGDATPLAVCHDLDPPVWYKYNSCAKQQAAGKCAKRKQENSKYCRKTCGTCS